MRKIAVVGGGASGLAAACAAAEAARRAGLSCEVSIYESDERVGRTILATGNGRCNLSNSQLDLALYRNADFVEAALRALEEASPAEIGSIGESVAGLCAPDNAVMSFFSRLGLAWRAESEGRLYPLANKASAVLDVLRARAQALGVREVCGARVGAVEPPRKPAGPFTLRMADGAFVRADAVVMAAGGRCSRSMLPEAFRFSSQVPVLAPLRTEGFPVKQLDGVRIRCTATLEQPFGESDVARAKRNRKREGRLSPGTPLVAERGEVLFRKYGISGIAVFNLSRYAQPGMQISLDLMPDIEVSQLAESFVQRLELLGEYEPVTVEVLLRGLVLPSIAKAICESADLDLRAPATVERARALAEALKGFRLVVAGIGDEHQSQVRRGGFDVSAFDPATMASRDIPGLYAVGEALDVDGPCGGYNLHWAWASGLLAGMSAVAWMMDC